MDLVWFGIAGTAAALVLYVALGAGVMAIVLNHLLTPGRVDWAGLRQPAPAHPLAICYRGDPQTAFGWDYEAVTYATALGAAEAWIVPPAAQAGGAWAIFVHGVGGIRENGYRQLSVMRDAAFTTMLLTYRNDRGAPASGGLHSFGLEEWTDLEAAVDYARARGASGIVLMAESMGGAIVGQFLARSPRAGAIAALILDAPALSVPATLGGILQGYRVPLGGAIVGVGLRLLSRWRGVDLRQAEYRDAVARFAGPIFLAHGSADQLVPVTISDDLARRRESRALPVSYLRTDGDHLRSWHVRSDDYRAGMLEVTRLDLPAAV